MKAKPGRRDELLNTLQQMSAVDAPGFAAAEHYRNVEDEDTLIGMYDWKSNESVWPGHSRSTPERGNSCWKYSQRPCASFWLLPRRLDHGWSEAWW
jgi:heme-degrading monooxygenase HmoA